MYWGPADGLARCPLPLSQVMGVNFGLFILVLYDSRLYRDFSPMTVTAIHAGDTRHLPLLPEACSGRRRDFGE